MAHATDGKQHTHRHVLIGVDPGLVHTGLVILQIDTNQRRLLEKHWVIEGEDHSGQVQSLLSSMHYHEPYLFVEKFRERGTGYRTNDAMRELLQEFKMRLTNPLIIDNTGSKQVVRQPLLQVLGLTDFPATHHQDLEAAARILVYGALKQPELNSIIAQIVIDYQDGKPWNIQK